MILLEYQNIKIFLQKATFQIGLEKFFVIKKVKNTVLLTYIFDDLKVQEIVGTFYENELQRTNQKEFGIGKVMKRKGDKLYVQRKGKDTVIHLTAGSIKRHSIKE